MERLLASRLVRAAATGCGLALLAGCASLASEPVDWTQPGPYEVRVRDSLTLTDAVQQRDVSMRVSWPAGDGPFPLVVFSHGAFCYPQQYANVTDFWVSHGYVVVLPDHLDSPNGPKMGPSAASKLLTSRVRDMSFVLDSLAALEQEEPQLAGRIDRNRVAVAGHSFGGMIAMIKSGLRMESQETGESVAMADERFRAAVVMSGVGQMEPMGSMTEVPTMAEDAFSGLQGPLIASGGTLDEGNVGTGVIYPWQWRMAPYNLAPAGDKYYIALENADHYLGGMICRTERGGDEDPVAVATVSAAQAAFLDAYVRDNGQAREWLQTYDFDSISQGRATFRSK